MKNPTKVVVIGAGYGGMIFSIRLAGRARHSNVQITLINGSDTFMERIRQHEIATGQFPTEHKIPHMLRGTGVNFLQGWATEINPADHVVTVKTGDGEESLSYDYLVYAVGSRVNQDRIPGVRENAYVLNPNGLNSTDDLYHQLESLKGIPARVAVVGGGATGIEVAGEIRACYSEFTVSLVTQGKVGTFKGEHAQPHFVDALTKQGIQLFEHKRVEEVRENKIIFSDGEGMMFDVCVWAGGFIVPTLAMDAGIEVNDLRQVLVDPYLRSMSHPQIYAIGDAARPVYQTGAPYRMSVFVAMTMGAHTADSLTRKLRGKAPKPFSFATYGQGIAVGKTDGLGFNSFPNDMPVGPLFRGVAAVKLRAFFVWFLLFAMELERRFPGFFLWFGKNKVKVTDSMQPVIATVENQVG